MKLGRRNVIIIVLAIAVAIILALVFNPQKASPPHLRDKQIKPAQSTVSEPQPGMDEETDQKVAPTINQPAKQTDPVVEPPEQIAEEEDKAFLEVTPKQLTMEVEYGQSYSTELSVKNISGSSVSITARPAAGLPPLSESPPPHWLAVLPRSITIGNGESKKVRVIAMAQQLDTTETMAQVLFQGSELEQQHGVLVFLKVKEAPVVKLSGYTVNDGAGANTVGNSNKVANAGERIELSVNLSNYGNDGAEKLEIKIHSDDPAVKFVGDTTLYADLLNKKEAHTVTFLIDIGQEAHPEIPPTVYLTTTDSKGRQWFENFYLGEDGAFQYPTGAIMPEEDEAKKEK